MANSGIFASSITGIAATVAKSTTINSTGVIAVDESIPDASTNLQIALAFDKDELDYFAMVSDKNITVKTNSSSSPANTFTLTAEVMSSWMPGMIFANPFSADVTTIFVTNASGSAARLQIRVMVDVTP